MIAATTRASSIGLVVFGGAFDSRRRAFSTILGSSSTIAGTSARPSSRQHARRLKPSNTS
jgi:hypothetical protein